MRSALDMAPIAGVHGSSHVYLQYPPLRCDIAGALGVTYDDGNKLLIVPTPGKVYSWALGSSEDYVVTTIQDGPVLAARFSLDSKVLAVLRSNTEVEFYDRETGTSFKEACKNSRDRILGLFWTDCPECDVVLITTSGLELYSLELRRTSLKLVEKKRQDVSWFVYTHESRLVLLASGVQCKTLSGYQFSAGGIVKLPKFEAVFSKPEPNRKPVLSPEYVHIATMYGRLYCLQIDPLAKVLHVNRFYRDAVISQGSLPVYAANVSISVIDNVLLVHQRDAKVVLLYDILSDSKVPVSAPLPMLVRKPAESFHRGRSEPEGIKPLPSGEASLYLESWFFVNPDMVLDHAHGLLWKINLDLEAIVASSSDVPSLLSFLQRRRQEAVKAKQLIAFVLRSVIMEKRPLPLISAAFDVVSSACGHAKRATSSNTSLVHPASFAAFHPPMPLAFNPAIQGMALPLVFPAAQNGAGIHPGASSDSHPESSRGRSLGRESAASCIPVLSPSDMFECVFFPIEEGMTMECGYLSAVVIEYMRSAFAEKLVFSPELNVLLAQLLSREQRYDMLSQLLFDKVFEPSKQLASQLVKMGFQSSQVKRLGVDMLRQVHAHKEYINCLIQDGLLVEALRYIRRNKIDVLEWPPPVAFLHPASKDQLLLASVLRFFCDFIPNFQQTEDYEVYCPMFGKVS